MIAGRLAKEKKRITILSHYGPYGAMGNGHPSQERLAVKRGILLRCRFYYMHIILYVIVYKHIEY